MYGCHLTVLLNDRNRFLAKRTSHPSWQPAETTGVAGESASAPMAILQPADACRGCARHASFQTSPLATNRNALLLSTLPSSIFLLPGRELKRVGPPAFRRNAHRRISAVLATDGESSLSDSPSAPAFGLKEGNMLRLRAHCFFSRMKPFHVPRQLKPKYQ